MNGAKLLRFWATVCETVRHAIRPLSVSVLPVTLVYCGQTVEWIKMKLATQVDLGPGRIVLDGTQLPLPKGAEPPQFSAHMLWPNGWMD